MNSNLEIAATWQNGLFRRSWRAFNRAFGALNRWRRRYLWIRLLFLVLLGAFVCKEAFSPIIPEMYGARGGFLTYSLPPVDAGSLRR